MSDENVYSSIFEIHTKIVLLMRIVPSTRLPYTGIFQGIQLFYKRIATALIRLRARAVW